MHELLRCIGLKIESWTELDIHQDMLFQYMIAREGGLIQQGSVQLSGSSKDPPH